MKRLFHGVWKPRLRRSLHKPQRKCRGLFPRLQRRGVGQEWCVVSSSMSLTMLGPLHILNGISRADTKTACWSRDPALSAAFLVSVEPASRHAEPCTRGKTRNSGQGHTFRGGRNLGYAIGEPDSLRVPTAPETRTVRKRRQLWVSIPESPILASRRHGDTGVKLALTRKRSPCPLHPWPARWDVVSAWGNGSPARSYSVKLMKAL